jgi:anti-anti-sigma factor
MTISCGRFLAYAGVTAMFEDPYPVRWIGSRAAVTLPEHIDLSNADQIREELLSVINRGATELIVDLTRTVSCDHAGADAVARAYQRGVVSGTQLRLVAGAPIVRRVLSISGLDRLISIYPSLEAAIAAEAPAAVVPPVPRPGQTETAAQAPLRGAVRARRQRPAGPRKTGINPAVLWRLIDALNDGVALADDDGMLALVNRRVEEMFGYEHGELIGQPVESLIPADLRAVHRSHRAAYAQAPTARPMGAGARLVGLRKHGATFPVEISLSPVPTATSHLTLAVIRDVTETRRRDDLADFARAAAAAERRHRGRDLLDRVVNSLSLVGISLQAAIEQPTDVAQQRIREALQRLDDTINEIRGHVLADRGGFWPDAAPPDGEHQD